MDIHNNGNKLHLESILDYFLLKVELSFLLAYHLEYLSLQPREKFVHNPGFELTHHF